MNAASNAVEAPLLGLSELSQHTHTMLCPPRAEPSVVAPAARIGRWGGHKVPGADPGGAGKDVGTGGIEVRIAPGGAHAGGGLGEVERHLLGVPRAKASRQARA